MRKKIGRTNSRKFKVKNLFSSRKSEEDDGSWIVLDADERSVKVPFRKKRRGRSLLVKGIAIACLSVSLPVCAKWGYGRVFFENEEFILRRLNIQTDGVLSEARLAEIANVAAGMNLMELDLSKIQGLIEKLPQVEKVSVTREMPDRINLVVRERMPVAWLSSPPLGIRPWDMERGYLMDARGSLFRCLDLNDGMKSLPVVEAFKIAEPVEGSKIESSGVMAGLKLIIESDRRFLEQGRVVTEVRIRDEWSLECVYGETLVVTFGIFDFARGLDDLALILERAEGAGQSLATVNVAAMKNIPVTFASSPGSNGSVPEVKRAGKSVNTEGSSSGSETKSIENEQEKHLRSILNGG